MTFRMCTKCSCWEHVKQSVPVLAMFLTCSYLFPGTLAPSVYRSPISPRSPQVLMSCSGGSLPTEEGPQSFSRSRSPHPLCVVHTQPSRQPNTVAAIIESELRPCLSLLPLCLLLPPLLPSTSPNPWSSPPIDRINYIDAIDFPTFNIHPHNDPDEEGAL